MAGTGIERYMAWDMHRVAGYLRTLDARIFSAVLAAQKADGLVGSVVEIGVHHGRSFILMALHRQAGESALAIDLFEDDEMYSDAGGPGRFGHFHENCRRLRVELSSDEVLKGSSLDLTPDDVLSRAGRARFFSIDGGHGYEHVANDLALAQEVVLDDGVVVVDDFASPFWPEVTFATYDWLRGSGADFAPFAITQTKLYLSDRQQSSRYREALAADPRLVARIGPEGHCFDDELTFLKRSLPDKLRDGVLRRAFAIERAAPRATRRASQQSDQISRDIKT